MREIAVKVCGVTSVADALACCAAGATMIGVNFAMGPRRTSIRTGAEIAKAVSGMAQIVGVFVDADPSEVGRIAGICGLDYIQLHGSEDLEYIRRLGDLRIIKALRPAAACRLNQSKQPDESGFGGWPKSMDEVLRIALLPNVSYLLVDACVPGRYGGTGTRADWSAAAAFGEAMTELGLRAPGDEFTGLAIAGGLGPGNVRHCIEVVGPDMLDLNSRVEWSPGKKNPARVAIAVAEMVQIQKIRQERMGGIELQRYVPGTGREGR